MSSQTPVEDIPGGLDLVTVTSARAVMVQLLLRCVLEPLNRQALTDALNAQAMLAEDTALASARLARL